MPVPEYVVQACNEPNMQAKALENLQEKGIVLLRGLFPKDDIVYVSKEAQQVLKYPALGGSAGYYRRNSTTKFYDALLLGRPAVDLPVLL